MNFLFISNQGKHRTLLCLVSMTPSTLQDLVLCYVLSPRTPPPPTCSLCELQQPPHICIVNYSQPPCQLYELLALYSVHSSCPLLDVLSIFSDPSVNYKVYHERIAQGTFLEI